MVFKLHVLHCFIWVLVAYKFGDWRDYKYYYPTILFFILGNFLHSITFYNFSQWFYVSSYMPHNIINLLAAFTIFPSTILLFLPYFPVKPSHQVLYFLKWICLYTFIELFFFSIGLVKYSNGWSLWWSAFHNAYQFPLLKLHATKPILAWFFSFVAFGAVVLIFKLPIGTIK
jgi:hypothetical protein